MPALDPLGNLIWSPGASRQGGFCRGRTSASPPSRWRSSRSNRCSPRCRPARRADGRRPPFSVPGAPSCAAWSRIEAMQVAEPGELPMAHTVYSPALWMAMISSAASPSRPTWPDRCARRRSTGISWMRPDTAVLTQQPYARRISRAALVISIARWRCRPFRLVTPSTASSTSAQLSTCWATAQFASVGLARTPLALRAAGHAYRCALTLSSQGRATADIDGRAALASACPSPATLFSPWRSRDCWTGPSAITFSPWARHAAA